jgi:hypothetical protein
VVVETEVIHRDGSTVKAWRFAILAVSGLVLVAALVLGAGGVSPAPAAGASFSDVPTGHAYAEAIADLSGRGIINGFADGTFKPDSPVNRQQFAKMIVKALGLTVTGSEICPFIDVDFTPNPSDPNYPAKYVAVCAQQGITAGKTATTFDPLASITRQQLITMVVRAAGLGDAPTGYSVPFAATQFTLAEHFANAKRAAYAGLLDGLGIGGTYSFSVPATRGECAQVLHNLIGRGDGGSGGVLAQRTVVAEFFYWYDSVSGDHMTPLALHPPAGQPFTWRDPGFFKDEFSNMIDAGIDIAACGFWPGEEWSTGGLPNLATALDQLEAEGKDPPGVAMFYETVPLWDRDLTSEAGKQYFYSSIRTFFSLVPKRHWGLIEGRPVIWLYDTGGAHISRYDAATFAYVRTHFQADFGANPYIAADKSWLEQGDISAAAFDATYTWGVAYQGFQPRDPVAGVGPGYDDHLVPDRIPPTIVPREDGAYYERNLYYALASGKNVLWLETWNEHHESTNINRTAEYGTTYIEITRRYVDMFKRGQVPPKPAPGALANVRTISVAATATGPIGQGLTLLEPGGDTGDGGWDAVQAAGRAAWKTGGSGAGRYLYFSIDDDFAWFDTPVTVDVTVDFLDTTGGPGSGTLQLEYDSYEPNKPWVLTDSYRPKTMASVGSTGTWRTATVRLSGVRFANGQNGGADFRLWTGENCDLTVAKVTVSKTGQ